jgi:hypothetical protein
MKNNLVTWFPITQHNYMCIQQLISLLLFLKNLNRNSLITLHKYNQLVTRNIRYAI